MRAVAAALREIERRGFSLAALAGSLTRLGDRPRAALGDHELVVAIVARDADLPSVWSDVNRLGPGSLLPAPLV